MKLIDMKSSAETEKSTMMAPEMRDEYPYGLRLNLNNETLAKLGMTELPAIDAEFKMVALVCVVGITQNESSAGEPYKSVDLQIEQLMLMPAQEEAGEGSEDKAKSMYPTMLS